MWTRTLSILLLLTIGSNAETMYPAKITLKSGRQIETKVIAVTAWGLKLENNQSIIYRVIREIETVEDSLVQMLSSTVSGIEVGKSEENRTILNFRNARPPVLPTIRTAAPSRFLAVTVSSDALTMVEIRFYMRSLFFKKSILYYGLSAGSSKHEENVRRFGATTTREKYHYPSVGFAVGGGVIHRLSPNSEVAAMIGYASKTVMKSTDASSPFASYEDVRPYGYAETSSVSLAYQRYFWKRRIICSIGAKGFIKRSEVPGNDRMLNIDIGWGWNFD